MITTVEQFIDELGGNPIAAEMFDAGLTTVCMWKARGRFPAWAKAKALSIARTNKMRVDPRLFEIPRPKPSTPTVHAAE